MVKGPPDGSNLQSPECDPKMQALQEQQNKENQAAQKQRSAAQALAMMIVAAPVWYFHWRLARKAS